MRSAVHAGLPQPGPGRAGRRRHRPSWPGSGRAAGAVAHEVRRSLTERSGTPVPPGAWQLLDDPAPPGTWPRTCRGVLATAGRAALAPAAGAAGRRHALPDPAAGRLRAGAGLGRAGPRSRWPGAPSSTMAPSNDRTARRLRAAAHAERVHLAEVVGVMDPPGRPAWCIPARGASASCGSPPRRGSSTPSAGCSAGPAPRAGTLTDPASTHTLADRRGLAPCRGPSTSPSCTRPAWWAAGDTGTRSCTTRRRSGRSWLPGADQQ